MPGGMTRQIALNRAWFDAADVAMADALFDFGKRVVMGADVPDAPPYGVGLRQGGGVAVWIGAKKVGQATTGAQSAVKKPRAAKLERKGATVIGGFGFPGRFVEEGTNDTAAEPFLTPELLATEPELEGLVREAAHRHQLLSKARAAAGDTYRGR